MNASPSPAPARSPPRLARAMLGGVFVACIAALVVLGAGVDRSPAPSAPSTSPGFLHAPATDPSVPAAEHVFTSRPALAETPAPTF